jgi:hypothetical protein
MFGGGLDGPLRTSSQRTDCAGEAGARTESRVCASPAVSWQRRSGPGPDGPSPRTDECRWEAATPHRFADHRYFFFFLAAFFFAIWDLTSFHTWPRLRVAAPPAAI